MDLPEDYSAYKKEEKLSEDAWIGHLSVHDRERPVQLISMYCLLINWMMQQNLQEYSYQYLMGRQQNGRN